ncbi:MAG: DUF1638 domain-containing protein [Thalassovita sp.]|nr:DUF1638 domain-containing protein [Thalassovita sp.]
MPFPDDAALTSQGLAPGGRGRVLIIACGALAREILALKAMNGWDHIDLACLPAILHNHPEKIPAAARTTIDKHRASYDRLFLAYADCGTGGALERLCAEIGIEMISGPHCYAFFTGNDAFSAHAEDDFSAFYLTDFLTRQFDAFVWQPLGLDRHPELRDSYFDHYTRLIYLAQTEDPALTAMAEDCATRLGLAFERRFTGYGDLATALTKVS